MNRTILIGVLVLALTTGVGVVQPTEHNDDTRCNAAYKANDKESMIDWCRASAEDHITDAADETGNLKAADLIYAVDSLGMVGTSQMMLDDSADGVTTFQRMRELLTEARPFITKDSTLRNWQSTSATLASSGY